MASPSAEWAPSLRQIFQDVQLQALEVSAYHFHPDGRHQRTLVPALRRLARLFADEVQLEGSAVAEEQFALFLDELWLALARTIVTPKLGDVVVEAVAALVGEFARKKRDDEPRCWPELRAELLARVAAATQAEDKAVRLRACQVLQLLLNRMDEFEKPVVKQLRDALLPRLHDKVTAIRVQSIYALKQLQDPDNERDKVTAALQRLMVTDPSKDVRKAAAMSVTMTDATFRDMLIRIRDVSDDVRYAAFQSIGSEMSVKDIPINDRVHMLDQGLQDRSARVRRACEQMVLRKWLPTFDRSPITMLKGLDVEQNSKIASKVCRLLLKHQSDLPRAVKQTDEEEFTAKTFLDATSDVKNLEAEPVFYWREQCYYYQKVDRDADKTAVLVPNISEFAKLLVAACKAGSDMHFVALQLLDLGHLLDYQDEFGRRTLLDALRNLLRSLDTDAELIKGIMELMAFIYAKGAEQEFIQVVAEVLNDMYEPLEPEVDEEGKPVAPRPVPALNKLSDEEHEAKSKRYEELEKRLETLDIDAPEYNELQAEMMELEAQLEDPIVRRWLRCLEILSQMLRLTSMSLSNAIIAGMGAYIIPAVDSEVDVVRVVGMECMGLYALLDKRVAEQYFVVFWAAINNEDEEPDVKMTCVKAIFDIALTYKDFKPIFIPDREDNENEGEEGANEKDRDGEENATEKESDKATEEPTREDGEEKDVEVEELDLDTVYIGLARLISIDDLDTQSTIVEGFARLFLLNRIQNVAVLAILLETYFNPKLQTVQLQGEHDFQSRSLQLLSVFFPAFATASVANCTLLEEAAMHLVQKSMEKADIESGEAINLPACGKYVLHLLTHREDANEDNGDDDEDTKPEISRRPASAASKTPKCAHHNRIAINICLEIMALERIAKAESDIHAELILVRQKMLMKMLILAEISARERRSGALMLFLLEDVAKTCFPLQKGLQRSAEAMVRRSKESFKQQLQKNGSEEHDESAALEQDREWSEELIAERVEVLEKALEEATELYRKQQKKRATKRRGRQDSWDFSSSSSEEDEEEEDEEDEDEDGEEGNSEANSASGQGKEQPKKKKKEEAIPPRREMSSRRSKTAAVSRMQVQEGEADAQLKQALIDNGDDEEDEEDESEEEEEESEEESSADED